MLTFGEADQLLDEVLAFLMSCGDYYRLTSRLEANILECLAVDQYIVHRNPAGEITHFICYWMITPQALEDLKEGFRPQQIAGGISMFVLEHGNKDGRRGMTRIINDLRQKEPHNLGAAWRHKGKNIKSFPRQKGDNHGW